MESDFSHDRLDHQFQITQVASWTFVAAILALVESGFVKTAAPSFLNILLLAFLASSIIIHHVIQARISIEGKVALESFNFLVFMSFLIHLTGGAESPFWLLSFLPIMISLALLQTSLSFWILSLTVLLCLLEMVRDYGRGDLRQIPMMVLNVFSVMSLTLLGHFLMKRVINERQLKDMALAEREKAIQERDEHYRLLQERQHEVEDFSRRLSEINHELMAQQTQGLHVMEALERTNRDLKKIDRMKSDFVSMVSHELKTPLTAIKESVALLLEDATSGFTSEQQKFLSITRHNTERLAHLIQDVLDFSKLESGKMRMRKEQIQAKQVFSLLKETYDRIAREKEIQLSFSSEGDCEVYADMGRLRQILDNFLSNAFKFTPARGQIEVSAEQVDQASLLTLFQQWRSEDVLKNFEMEGLLFWKYFVIFSVKDNGIGIAKGDRSKIFERFFQLETQDARPRGTGLGLAIVKQLVLAHQGGVWVESEIGKGAVFKVCLPSFQEAFHPIQVFNAWVSEVKAAQAQVIFLLLDFGKISYAEAEFDQRLDFLNHLEPFLQGILLQDKERMVRAGIARFCVAVLDARHEQVLKILERIQKRMREQGWSAWESRMQFSLHHLSEDQMNYDGMLALFDRREEDRNNEN